MCTTAGRTRLRRSIPSLFNVIRYANAAAGDDMGAFLCWMAVRVLEMRRVLKDTGSMYLHCDPTASHYLKAMMDAIFGRKQFRNEIIWAYGSPGSPSKWFPRKHDVILFYAKTDSSVFNKDAVKVPHKRIDSKLKKFGHAGEYAADRPRDELEAGKMPFDWWNDIAEAYKVHRERTGYPTQKPLKLYKRMIQASSNPDDMVLDPFAGCATTCVAAEQLGRRWIGIDIREESGGVIRDRLEREVSENMAWDAIVRTPTTAPERTDDGEPAAPELMLVSPKPNARRISVREAREQLIVRDGQRCQGCGWEPQWADYLQVDHKRPKTLKGMDEMDNYVLLCDPCNRKKSNKLTLAELRIAREAEGRIDEDWYEEEKWK